MIKNIDEEIAKLLKIKETVDAIKTLRLVTKNLQVMSRARYDFLASKNLIKPDSYYYIADLEIKPYVEDFQG